MSSQRLSLSRIAVFGGFAIATGWLAFGGNHSGTAGQLPVIPGNPQIVPVAAAAPDDRATDKAAILKALDGFAAGFKKGDGKAVASLWTTEGEYTSDDGTTFSGRAALEKAYTEFFAKNPDNSMEIEVDSIKFPSRDNAVVEGHFKLQRGKKKELVVSKCSFLYTREDGKWLVAIAREWPGDGLSLRDLEWLIGTWEAKRDGMTVNSKYEWTANKSFIRCDFSITQGGKNFTGMQMIGKDPSTGMLHSWTFEDEGGIGGTDISRDGKKWVYTARAVTTDGRVVTTTNIMTQIDNDSFLWHVTERAIDDEELPDLPPIKVTRVKAKK
ncbi:MAG: nuclear transport factor 2 family protein [Planctomycetes bacterium]|nr:nuclear transport factor 2 family protein [Planctomycetota bacterium]